MSLVLNLRDSNVYLNDFNRIEVNTIGVSIGVRTICAIITL